jgi:hypothetical protein
MWELHFEFSEDFRHKQLVGPVPQAALVWLENHWELLPRDGWQHEGSLKGEPGKPAVMRETMKLVVSNDHDEAVVKSQSEEVEEVTL